MAHTLSAKKRIRQNEKRRARNKTAKSRIKTRTRNVAVDAGAGDEAAAKEGLRRAASELDRAARKGVIHRRKADRRKARLARTVVKKG